MTSITTESTIRRPSLRSARQSILGFVAGVALASLGALGINAASADHSPVTPVSGSPAASVPVEPNNGCQVFHGRC